MDAPVQYKHGCVSFEVNKASSEVELNCCTTNVRRIRRKKMKEKLPCFSYSLLT